MSVKQTLRIHTNARQDLPYAMALFIDMVRTW
ncbi:hypothetical protein AE00_05114 [Klebsiella pneumoniae MGH 74]|uniref:Uncharacterized protein n=1 Tax=Klebsiella pneumoniae TaxID=573 RepID=A0A486R7U0_KLEPN|nr:hypothetical protein AE00_05114 [Klebsiella pneumoniae MGH 74]MDR6246954.1 hypothetical protein [Klebsiella variicola]MDR6257692.1 hypothetical protein [Klebsiella sp. SORGH_AS_0826]MDR6343243.1 hypothetical protein [Klebsiella sp. SORGH_AS_1025]MDR6358821.1 hypothetical protein [Klebsiella sp. SORGH_AS_1173]SAV50880.1 Uncharacterised protein [Klebsiella pneumoniae]SXC65131.1 Uncharacterised protein [Klebsiella quasipneumoniae]VGP56171.1 hypothetical protein SB02110_05004 [Klebsiella quas